MDRGDRAPAGAVPRALGNYKWAISVAVMASWGGMFLAVGVAGIGAILGAVVGLLVAFGAGIGAPAWLAPFVSNSAPLAAIAGAVGGAVAGLGVVYGSSLAVGPGRFLTAAASGLVLAVLLTVFSAVAEGWVLRLRGARHMSTREADRIRPALQDAAAAVSGGRLPRVVMFDQPQVGAAMGFRHLMLNRGCLNLEDSELRGVLAHELHHWVTGDVVGTRLVWGAAWPVVVLYNLGVFLATDGGTVGRVAWVVLWPAAVIMRGVVGPALGLTSRQREYAADRAARLAGYGPALQSVLDMHRELEPGRTGWERVLNAEHPPTELRVDALLNPDVADTRPEIPVGVAAAGVLLVLAAVFGLWAVAAITPPGTGIRSAEPTAIPPTATPVPPSIAIRGTWEAVSYNGAPIPGASVTTLTFERRGIVLGHGARPVDNWLGSYRLLGPHRIAFDNGHSRWTAHYSVFGPDLETDVPGQRSVWRRIH